MKCEACEENDVGCEFKLTTTKEIYKLCLNCMFALNNTCLDQDQFENLIKNGHKDTEFYLHSDFYDEEGVALQPR